MRSSWREEMKKARDEWQREWHDEWHREHNEWRANRAALGDLKRARWRERRRAYELMHPMAHGYQAWMRPARRRIFLWFVIATTLAWFVGNRISHFTHAPEADQHHGPGFPWALLLLGVLWLFAHKVATRLAKPLAQLVDVTDAMGRGDFRPNIQLPKNAAGEVQRLAGALLDLGERIETQMAEQRTLLASVSHELRSPLARVNLLTELTRQAETEADRDKHLSHLEAEVQEMDALVGALLASSKLDFSATARAPVDLEDLVNRVADRMHAKDRVAVRGAPKTVVGDSTLLSRALENILQNAKTHGEGIAGIDVNYTEQQELSKVVLSVWDKGPGLPDGDPAQMFALFFRQGGREHGDLGLGLHLVERIVRAHGGEVFAEAGPDRVGARVGFWLPTANGVV